MFPLPAIEPRFTGRAACSVVPFLMSFPTRSGTVLHCSLNEHFDANFPHLHFVRTSGCPISGNSLTSLKTEAADLSEMLSLVSLDYTTLHRTRR